MDHKFEAVLSSKTPVNDVHVFLSKIFGGELVNGTLGSFKGCSVFGAKHDETDKTKVRLFFQVDSVNTVVASDWLESFLSFYFQKAHELDPSRPEVTVDIVPFGIERTKYGVRNTAKTVDSTLSRASAGLVKEPITIQDHKPISITKRSPV